MAEAAASSPLLSLLRVPPEPEAPAGAPGSMRVFNAAKNFLWYRIVQWGLKQIGALWGLIAGLTFIGWVPEFPYDDWVRWVEYFGILTFVVQLPVTFVGTLYDYRLRWYIVTDRSLRIREGIFKVQERTMSFANIQNLAVKQGPLQRALGISDLEVKSAGGGQKSQHGNEEGDDLHSGYFRGVDNAEEIKTLILERLRRLRDSGLGDPEEEGLAPELPAAPAESPLVAAAHQLLEEAKRLRAAVGSPI
jgi:membrane protein YdbS with pleckstrin-like domain